MYLLIVAISDKKNHWATLYTKEDHGCSYKDEDDDQNDRCYGEGEQEEVREGGRGREAAGKNNKRHRRRHR